MFQQYRPKKDIVELRAIWSECVNGLIDDSTIIHRLDPYEYEELELKSSSNLVNYGIKGLDVPQN